MWEKGRVTDIIDSRERSGANRRRRKGQEMVKSGGETPKRGKQWG